MDPYSALIKWGGLAVGAIAIIGVAFYQGMEFTQTRWDAAVAQQQMRTGEFIMQQTYNSVRSEQLNQQNLQRQESEKRILAKKVRDYERSTNEKCELSSEFESVADGLIRVRQPTTDSLSPAADPSGIAHAADQPRLTDTAVLRFIESAVAQLHACADQANELIDWENSSRAIATEGAGR